MISDEIEHGAAVYDCLRGDFFQSGIFEFRYFFCCFLNMKGLVSRAAKRRGRYIRRVGFEDDAVDRDILYYFVVIPGECYHSAEREGEAHVQQLTRIVFRSGEEVNDSWVRIWNLEFGILKNTD